MNRADRLEGLTPVQKREWLARLLEQRAGAEVIAPTSYAQQRLWFLDQLASGSAFYNMPVVLRLRFALDVRALERAVNEIVARHEVLRTTFRGRDGSPVQVILPRLEIVIPETDLTHLPPAEREEEAQRLATLESRRPFELAQAPLLRIGLLRMAMDEFVLLLTLHHIIADGWSLGVLFRELSALYSAFSAGQASPLPPLPIQFADYAVWQRNWLKGPVLEEQLRYWVRQLDGLPALVLPTDRERPAIATFHGARRFFEIPGDIVEPVQTLAKQTGATLFMVLLAAFQVLLSRYGGQEDFPVGVPIANRTRKETEGLIGFFVNTLVLRADLSGRPTFRELIARVRETAVAAYAHQDLPFDRLIEELRPARDAASTPLIQVMFALQNAVGHDRGLDGAPMEVVEVERGTANFDLVLDLWERDSALGGRLEYSTDLFDAATIERMLGHFQTLLSTAAAAPDEPVDTLEVMTAEERRRIAHDLNATSADYPAHEPVTVLFEHWAFSTPAATALEFGTEHLTYAETNARANQLAHYLRAAGIGRGDFVAVRLEPSASLVVALLGILKAGAAYVPLDVTYPVERLAAMMQRARPRAIVTDSRLAASLPQGHATLVLLDADADMIQAQHVGNLAPVATGDDAAYVMFTSGSTGTPKGIVIPHRAISRLVCNTNYITINPSDRIAQAANISFDASTFEIWGALLTGARVVGLPRDIALVPTRLGDFLREQAITTLFLTTAVFNQVARTCPEAFAVLTHLLFGGEAVDPRLVREVLQRGAPQRLLHVYGPTECTTFATWHRVESVAERDVTVPIGGPISNTTAYVLGRGGHLAPPGAVGELYIGGPGLALGYLDDVPETSARFVSTSFGRLYRTGDLVRRQSDGTLIFVGRRDNQIKLRGHRVELEEIESTLLQHTAVRAAKIAVRDHGPDDRRLAAYVVLDREAGAGERGSDERVGEWRQVYDEVIYEGVDHDPTNRRDPLFNITGWASSYTGEPLSPDDMREQVDQTVERILAFAPSRVLEIGCGTGLLLFRVAPHTSRYVATDFSSAAVAYVRQQLTNNGNWPVTLLERRADDFEGLEHERFDLVVLNSVVQYFPDVDYLMDVLRRAASVLAPGGKIYVGDVRNLLLLEAFHASVELHQAPGTARLSELCANARRRMASERELVIAPQFFSTLGSELSPLRDVRVHLKRGRKANELTIFRYDVTLAADASGTAPPTWLQLDWRTEVRTIEQLRRQLSTSRPALLCVTRVPNARASRAILTAERLREADEDADAIVSELRRTIEREASDGVDPELFWALSDDVPYAIEISWAAGWPDGAYDVVLRHADAQAAAAPAPTAPTGETRRTWTNHPQHAAAERKLVPQLRAFLQAKLPEFMLPASFVVMEALPLTANGKVDVSALPAPEQERPALEARYVPPGSALERLLAIQWQAVLGVSRVGITDSFFELGGHSLLATQLVARITATLRVPLNLRTIFSKPTIAELAAALPGESGMDASRLERTAALVLAIADMPEEEAAARLASRTAGHPARRLGAHE